MSKYGKAYYKLLRVLDEPDDYFWVQNISGSTKKFQITATGNLNGRFEYSRDKTTWSSLVFSGNQMEITNILNNEKVYLRGVGGFSKDTSNYYTFIPQGDIAYGGNIGRLVNWKENLTKLPDYSFYHLSLQNSSFVKDISEITFGSIKKIGVHALDYAFYGTYITKTPDFSGIEEIEDYGMNQTFSNCNSLQTVGDFSSLKIVGDYGMQYMFNNSQNIQTVGDFSSLTTVGVQGMYQMFQNCTNSTFTGIDLSSLTSVGNQGLGCLYQYCYNISEITAPNLQEWNINTTVNWLSNTGSYVQGTKTANVPAGLTIPENSNGVPSGWTRVEY